MFPFPVVTNKLAEKILVSIIFLDQLLDIMLISWFHQILQQIRSDVALLTLQDGGPPIQNPSTAAEDARLASLISLDGIVKQVKVYLCAPFYFILFYFFLVILDDWAIVNLRNKKM